MIVPPARSSSSESRAAYSGNASFSVSPSTTRTRRAKKSSLRSVDLLAEFLVESVRALQRARTDCRLAAGALDETDLVEVGDADEGRRMGRVDDLAGPADVPERRVERALRLRMKRDLGFLDEEDGALLLALLVRLEDRHKDGVLEALTKCRRIDGQAGFREPKL